MAAAPACRRSAPEWTQPDARRFRYPRRAAWKTFRTFSLPRSSKSDARSMPSASASTMTTSSRLATCTTQSLGQTVVSRRNSVCRLLQAAHACCETGAGGSKLFSGCQNGGDHRKGLWHNLAYPTAGRIRQVLDAIGCVLLACFKDKLETTMAALGSMAGPVPRKDIRHASLSLPYLRRPTPRPCRAGGAAFGLVSPYPRLSWRAALHRPA